ncbi:MAG: Crp/Fnr family transcriptional regulator [Clostridia bacterium]|nr:Crp/Fnr family transcriptional regulator [Clostridia bacterium]
MLACLNAGVRRCAKGETILAEGGGAQLVGVVLSGCVQVSRTDYNGSRSLIARLAASDLFAEAFAFAGVQALPVSVTAAEDAEVLLLDASRITQSCASACAFHRQMIDNLMRILALKSLAFSRKLEIISRRTTREKLMTYLTQQAAQAGSQSFVIPFDRQELADYLEVDRSGLSAVIGTLRREGVLRSEKSRFTLLKTPDA